MIRINYNTQKHNVRIFIYFQTYGSRFLPFLGFFLIYFSLKMLSARKNLNITSCIKYVLSLFLLRTPFLSFSLPLLSFTRSSFFFSTRHLTMPGFLTFYRILYTRWEIWYWTYNSQTSSKCAELNLHLFINILIYLFRYRNNVIIIHHLKILNRL